MGVVLRSLLTKIHWGRPYIQGWFNSRVVPLLMAMLGNGFSAGCDDSLAGRHLEDLGLGLKV